LRQFLQAANALRILVGLFDGGVSYWEASLFNPFGADDIGGGQRRQGPNTGDKTDKRKHEATSQ
jgi:hypothetical protein